MPEVTAVCHSVGVEVHDLKAVLRAGRGSKDNTLARRADEGRLARGVVFGHGEGAERVHEAKARGDAIRGLKRRGLAVSSGQPVV